MVILADLQGHRCPYCGNSRFKLYLDREANAAAIPCYHCGKLYASIPVKDCTQFGIIPAILPVLPVGEGW